MRSARSSSRQLRRGQSDRVLPQAASGSSAWRLVQRPIIGRGVDEAWPHRAADAGELREGLRQTVKERCCRCCRNLRGRDATKHAFRAGQVGREQTALMLHRSRDLLVRQRTQLINALRAHLAEVGLVAAAGVEGSKALVAIVTDETNRTDLPGPMRQALFRSSRSCLAQEQIGTIERSIHAQHRASDASRRLESVPGIGVIGATAIAATVTDPTHSNRGASLPPGSGSCRASIRLAASRGSEISKQGDRYLRRLLVVGATAVIRHARAHPEKQPWLTQVCSDKARENPLCPALANKMARIACTPTRGETYRALARLVAGFGKPAAKSTPTDYVWDLSSVTARVILEPGPRVTIEFKNYIECEAEDKAAAELDRRTHGKS